MKKPPVLRYGYQKGLILHSDHGSQYTSQEYRTMLAGFGSIRQSMGRTHCCFDNARMESFFATLKKELVYRVMPVQIDGRGDMNAFVLTSPLAGVMLLTRRQPFYPSAAHDKFFSICTAFGGYTEFGIVPVYRLKCSTMKRDEVRKIVFRWIETYYNRRRRNTANELNLPPLVKRARFADHSFAA